LLMLLSLWLYFAHVPKLAEQKRCAAIHGDFAVSTCPKIENADKRDEPSSTGQSTRETTEQKYIGRSYQCWPVQNLTAE